MATNLQANWDLTEASNLFKIKYGQLSDNSYNSANVLLGRVKKSYNFVGKKMEFPIPLSFQGGVGSGSLPEANVANYEDVFFTAKKMYAVTRYDRESVKASMSDEGSFVRGTKETVKKTVESWNRNMSRALFGDGTGALGTIGAAVTGTGTSGDPYLCTISSATWKEANFEERDFVNVDTSTDLFEVSAVDADTRVISLVAQSGATHTPADTEVIYMQGSKDNDPEGLKGVLDATTGSKYGVAIARRWQSYQLAAASAGITPDLLNKTMLNVEKRSGKTPNMILTSYLQYEKILNQLEDQKRYSLDPRAKNLKGKVSFEGVEFMSSQGPIGIFPERFCEDDRVYVLNDNFIEIFHRPGFGWFDDDGTVFLRTNEDSYEARYGGYMETYIAPPFHGVITGLAT